MTIYPILFLLTIATLPIWTGCSIAGLAIGSAIDAHAHDTLLIKQVSRLHLGDDIFLLNADGEHIEGKLIRLEKIPIVRNDTTQSHDYRITFLSLASGARRSGYLAGFDDDTLWIRLDGNNELSQFGVEKVNDITNNQSQIINQESLSVIAGNLPPLFHKLLDISVGDTERKVPVDEIRQIRYNKSQSSRWTLLAIGVAVDAAIISLGIFIQNSFTHSK